MVGTWNLTLMTRGEQVVTIDKAYACFYKDKDDAGSDIPSQLPILESP